MKSTRPHTRKETKVVAILETTPSGEKIIIVFQHFEDAENVLSNGKAQYPLSTWELVESVYDYNLLVS